MPELPEVETVKNGLQRLLPGRVIRSVDFDWPKSFPNAPEDVEQFLIGAEVVEVKRRAKVLLIELNSKYSLVTHLKMTGQLVFVGKPSKQTAKTKEQKTELRAPASSQMPVPADEVRFGAGHPSDSLVGELPAKSTRVTLTFNDDSQLFFNDQRKFGWMRLIPTAEVPMLDFFKKVGPEPLNADFTWQQLREKLLRRQNTSIKAALLDQSVVAGVGNIYADESLWGAKIHPAILVRNLRPGKFKLLHKSLRDVLQLSIEKGGSTDKDYVDAEGRKGSYLSFAHVFRKQGQPCPRCATTIIKTRVAGRGTHFCPHCQKQ